MTLGLFCPEAVGPCKVVVVPSDGLILVLGGILSYLRAPEADAPAARVGVNEPDGRLFFSVVVSPPQAPPHPPLWKVWVSSWVGGHPRDMQEPKWGLCDQISELFISGILR